MWPEDMPTPGTRQFSQWFDQQDPEVQDQIIFDFGLGDANQPVMGNAGSGMMTPEISPQGFGLLDQMQAPPVINSKGVVQPYGTEQQAKRLNLFQDENSLLTDNVMAAIAGQFAPTAFQSTYTPQGNPIQATGLRQLQSLANTGGWEGFMASQMLPKEYGGSGMSSSQAKGALMKALQTPDDADETALSLREELRGSLTPRYETQGESTNPQYKPLNKDLSTPQGIVNSFDFSDVDTVSRGWQSDLAKDPIAGYKDPVTGLSYEGAKEVKTPTMEWFDKYGLPYANKRYDDPDQVTNMQDAVAPWAMGQSQDLEDQQGQDALAANQLARDNLANAKSQHDVLMKAYNEVIKPGAALDPNKTRTISAPVGKRSVVTPDPADAAFGVRNKETYPTMYGQMARPVTLPANNSQQSKFLVDLDASGNITGLSPDQRFPGIPKPTQMNDGLQGSIFTDWTKPGAVIPNNEDPVIAAARGMLPQQPGGQVPRGDRRVMQIADLKNYANRIKDAQHAAAATVPGIQRASQSSDTSMQRQLARGRMLALAASGRTPLSDTLAGRIMAARSAGVYG